MTDVVEVQFVHAVSLMAMTLMICKSTKTAIFLVVLCLADLTLFLIVCGLVVCSSILFQASIIFNGSQMSGKTLRYRFVLFETENGHVNSGLSVQSTE